jgi:hypothetical protein
MVYALSSKEFFLKNMQHMSAQYFFCGLFFDVVTISTGTAVSIYSDSGMTHVLSSIDSPWIEVIPIKDTLPYTPI